MPRLPLVCLGLLVALGACAELRSAGGGGPLSVGGSCAASQHQDWVGQRVDVLNDVELPQGTRVLFPTTPATADTRDDRMNVVVDKSDTITRVYCG